MNIKNLIGLGAISAVLLAGVARAQTTPFYAGVNYSWSIVDPDPRTLKAVGLQSEDFDKDAPKGYKIYGGYQINPTWGIEVAYADFGGTPVRGFVNVNNTTTALIEPTTVTGIVDMSSISVVATATVPFAEGVNVTFRAGPQFWNTDASAGTAIALPTGNPPALPTGFRLPASISADDSGMDWILGVGLQFDFHPRWAFRLDIDRYLGDNNVYSFAGGFQFKF